MAIPKVPPGDAPLERRVEPEKVWFDMWYVPAFPMSVLGGKLDKDVTERPWIMGLKADIAAAGRFLNPVIVWNHHPLRGKKQPWWLLRAGSNRVWCAEQLGWDAVPAIVTADPKEPLPNNWPKFKIRPDELQEAFPDGGNVWANEHGIGLLRAKKPEVTYSRYIPTSTELSELKPTNHDLISLINPMLDE